MTASVIPPGTRLGSYEFVAPIGAGGMGEVYRARDTTLGRDVAIKILPQAFASDQDRVERFEREARTLATLKHPHIAQIYGLERANDIQALVLELVDGETLADRIRRGPLPVPEAVEIAKQIASALHAAHLKGIVHRDLKPANVMVEQEITVKVLDFGLARAADSPVSGTSTSPTIASPAMTGAGMILGTAAYMSPEQAKGRTADRRSDVWAFGCVLYEMLTGTRAFGGEDVTEVITAVVRDEPDWTLLPAELPPAASVFLRRCLEKDPNRRVQDIGDVRLALEGAFDVELSPPVTERVSARGGGRRLIVVAALAAAAGSLLMWTVSRGGEADSQAAVVRKLEVARFSEGRAGPVISPDGRWVAYYHQDQMWLRPLAALEERPVPDSDGSSVAIWSPDSRWIAYQAGGRLLRVPVEGGRPHVIATLPHYGDGLASGGGWGPDGRIVFTSGYSGLLAVPASGGEVTTLLAPAPGESDYHNAHLLPDGRGVIFGIHLRGRPQMPLAVFRDGRKEILDGLPGPALSHPHYDRSGHLIFRRSPADAGVWAVPFSTDDLRPTGEASLVAAGASWPSSDHHGNLLYQERLPQLHELVWLDRTGRVVETLGEPMNWLMTPALSPDGRRVAFVATDGQGTDIWLRDLERRTTIRLTFTPDVEAFVRWAPAGDQLAFHTEGAEPMLHVIDLERGAAPVTIGAGGRPTWRPDGGLVYELFGARGIWTLPPALAAETAVEVLDYPTDESVPALSPDGRFMVLLADPSGKPEIYVTRFPSGEGRWPVSRGSANVAPLWSPRGDEIFYVDHRGMLMAVPVRTAPEVALGPPQPLFAPRDKVEYFWSFDVDNDARRFLMTRPVSGEPGATRLVHVQGWLRGLRAGR